RRDVVEHLRPRRLERDELVERVPGEARRAARLRVAHRPLGVGGGGAREEQEHLTGERAAEAAARLDRRADDDELGPALRGDACDVLAEPAGARADDL